VKGTLTSDVVEVMTPLPNPAVRAVLRSSACRRNRTYKPDGHGVTARSNSSNSWLTRMVVRSLIYGRDPTSNLVPQHYLFRDHAVWLPLHSRGLP
jgi:hypothetical protein